MIFYKMWIYFQIVSLRPYDVLDDRMINFFWSLLSKWILYNCLRVLKDLLKNFWDQNWPQWSSKNDRFQALKTHYRSIIFQKMTNSAFSCNKNGLVGRGMLYSNYYQSIPRLIRKWKHMHILGLWRLDPAESASESLCKHFKKSFFGGQSHTQSLSKIWFSTKCEFIFKSSL